MAALYGSQISEYKKYIDGSLLEEITVLNHKKLTLTEKRNAISLSNTKEIEKLLDTKAIAKLFIEDNIVKMEEVVHSLLNIHHNPPKELILLEEFVEFQIVLKKRDELLRENTTIGRSICDQQNEIVSIREKSLVKSAEFKELESKLSSLKERNLLYTKRISNASTLPISFSVHMEPVSSYTSDED